MKKRPIERRRAALHFVVATVLLGGLLAGPAAATPPGTNGKIAFVQGGEVLTVDPSGGAATQITTTGGAVASLQGCCFAGPAFSPNGQTIAYHTAAGIFTVPAGGGPSTAVTGTVAGNGDVNWSPSGTTLVYTCGTGLCTVPAAGGAVTAVTGTAAGDAQPEYKPDGSEIAFSRPVGAAMGVIFTVPAAGGPATQRTPVCPTAGGFPGCFAPTYKPDGSQIAYTVGAGACTTGTYSIASIPSGGGGPTTVFAAAGRDAVHAVWSPDGQQIVFQDCFPVVNTIDRVAAGGGSATQVFATAPTNRAPSWGVGSSTTVPPVTNPSTPAFSAPTCGSAVSVPAIGSATLSATIAARASDADAGQSVSLSASGLPTWASFASTPGNPANGTITANPDLLTWALGSLGDLARSVGLNIPGLPTATAQVTLTATDNGSPAKSATCAVTLRVRLAQGSPV